MYHPESPLGRWQRAVFQTHWQGLTGLLGALGNVAFSPGTGSFWPASQVGPSNANWNTAPGMSPFQNWTSATMGLAQQVYEALAGPGPSFSPAGPFGFAQNPGSPETSAALQIVCAADAFLASVPDGGALLSHLVENVALKTGYDLAMVSSVILRNFDSNGLLVWRAGIGLAGPGRIVAHMQRALHYMGYEEFRHDYPLTGIPERRDRAALLAFVCDMPAILGYPVSRGQVSDPLIREAALFQAGSVSPHHRARFVWVSDGIDDFFYDFYANIVISHLPPRRASFWEVEP
jgi:hypothetical protein